MSRQRFIALAIAAVLAIGGALYLSTQRNLPRDSLGTVFLPYLADDLESVSALAIRRGGATPGVTMQKKDGRWTLSERGDYPVDVSKLRKLLLALNDARIVEEKTSNPASFPIIGVDDPSAPGASGAEISLTARDGRHAVIIGKPVGDGNFARRAGEDRSYIVEPGISFEVEPRYWIESKLMDIPVADIQSLDVKPSEGLPYSLHRTAPGEAKFTLEGVPSGRKALDPASLGPSPAAFGNLNADDVAAARDVDFSKPALVTVTLANGNVLTLTGTAAGTAGAPPAAAANPAGAASGGKRWIQIKASKDAPLAAKADGRAFEIPAYRYDAIFRPLEQLLVPKEPPPGANKAAAPPGAGASSGSPPPRKKIQPAPAS